MEILHRWFWLAVSLTVIAGMGCHSPTDESSRNPTADAPSTPADQPRAAAANPVPRGDRLLGIDIADVPEGGTYADNVAKALGMNAGATSLSLQWNQIEAKPNRYTDPGSALAISNAYYPTVKLKLSLNIRSIDTVVKPVPDDLKATPFDNAALIARYRSMIDWVLDQIPNVDLVSLQIGNEIDVNSISTAAFWAQYKTFVSQVASHVHTKRPGTLVGFTVTHGAAGSDLRARILDAAAGADVIGITYYPLKENSVVLPISVVADDFAKIVEAFGAKPIYFQEVGYPTGNANQSSEALQSQFLESVFAAWDQHAAKIPVLSIDRLVDYNHDGAVAMATEYGFRGNAPFISFLETLGMQRHSGTDKVAIATLKRLTQERGW